MTEKELKYRAIRRVTMELLFTLKKVGLEDSKTFRGKFEMQIRKLILT